MTSGEVVIEHPGPFASESDWKSAVEIYRDNATTMFLALFTRSLPASLCSASGSAVLDPAGVGVERRVDQYKESLIADSFRRLGGTARHLDAFFHRDPEQRRTALAKIRRWHDAWRCQIERMLADQPDPPAELRDPLNDEQILGTACTFVVPVREMFDEFLVPGKDAIDWDAWSRVWCDIAVVQGAKAEYVQAMVEQPDYAGFRRASDEIEGGNRERSLSGVRLMRNLIDDMRDGLPHWSRNSFLTALAAFGEDDVLELLLVPPRPGTNAVRRITRAGRVLGPLNRLLWWTLRRSVQEVRKLALSATTMTEVARLFPGFTDDVEFVPLPCSDASALVDDTAVSDV